MTIRIQEELRMTQPTPELKPWDETLRQAFVQPRHAAGQFAQCTRTPAEAWALLEQLHAQPTRLCSTGRNAQNTPVHPDVSSAAFCGSMRCRWRCSASPTTYNAPRPRRPRRGTPTPARAAFCSPWRSPVWVTHCGGSLRSVRHTPDDLPRVPFLLQVRLPTSFEGRTSGPTADLDEPLHMLVAAMQEGIERGLAEHGFESGWVELNEALLHALDLPPIDILAQQGADLPLASE